MWNERYAEEGFAYGSEPNDFVAEVTRALSPGRALDLAGGEGRNAVYLAGLGHHVLIVDGSRVGLAKAKQFAAQKSLSIETIEADLAAWSPEPASCDLIVSSWAHVPPAVRRTLHAACVRALRPGGHFVLEAYTPEQITRATGGPRDPSLCMTAAALREELAGLEVHVARELERHVSEGKYHQGMSSVVQFHAQKS